MNRARDERASGIDEIEFRIRANPGHPPTPLAQTASGGEQSRVSLGILVATRGGLPVMVFDEIDSGVGGRVAELVGRHLRHLAETCQVLCVTHLPQVASQAHGHLTVSKGANGSMTSVRVGTVTGEERTEEIARMLAGTSVTARSRAHAREMLEAARQAEMVK
jgi:DNA repair protein RecN (Recombination protein N)